MSFAAVPVLLFLLVAASSSPSAVADDALTAYEALAAYNFPAGILPEGIVGYELDKSTGKFRANWNGSCSFSLEGSYQLKYASTIRGVISENKITNLSGVSVKILFLWLNIVEVVRYDKELGFSVGIASASFPIDNFYECPRCGCGLDCNGVKVSKLRTNLFVSSI
ncbi:uncharacterized protein [Euphorbia lathyris]|uniref:uncharacterized protein n=1 Tax=Euphorbia lathyris TaxID=212925 RepID=UPI0033134C0D